MKKLLIILGLFLITIQGARANNPVKITGLNFDTSGSVLFIGANNEASTGLEVTKPTVLTNPLRIYFDINSSILVNSKEDLIFSGKDLKEVKIGQFTVNPNVVRIVMYFNSNYNPENLKINTSKYGITVFTTPISNRNDYFQNTYREETVTKGDYYEGMTVTEQKKITVSKSTGEEVITQIQQAFDEGKETTQLIKKQIEMRTKYYVSFVTVKDNVKGFLVNGYGSITVEKPILLANPMRIVYDIPNAYVNPKIRNKEIKLPNSTDTIKIGQFEKNKARIVVTSDTASKYLPIYSSDNQSLLIANPTNLKTSALNEQKTNAIGYYAKKTEDGYDTVITMDEPVIHALKRESGKFTIYIFNGDRYNDSEFIQTMKGINGIKMSLMPEIGMRLSVPASGETQIKTYLSTDGKSIKLSIKEPTSKLEFPSFVSPNKTTDRKVIVLDAGHGGSDYGAIREGVNEKDINLDITKRVAAMLTKKGYDVHLVRNDDTNVSLEDRVNFSESIRPDVFISIHVNASVKQDITGIETHYYRDNSIKFAEVVHSKLTGYVKTNDRGLFKSKFYVINHTTSPAVLVEVGFISNPDERTQLLGDKRKQVTAKAISEGIIEYLKK